MCCCTACTRFSTSSSPSKACFWATSILRFGARKSASCSGFSMFMIIVRACSGASGVSSNNREAESRKFRNVASHSLLGGGRIDCGKSISARRNGSVAIILRSEKRRNPCTITSTLSSDCRTSLSTSAAVPIEYRSCGNGSSFVSSRCVSRPITFVRGNVSSSSLSDADRWTFRGITVPGKTTKLRTGRIDSSSGIRGVRLSSTPSAMVP